MHSDRQALGLTHITFRFCNPRSHAYLSHVLVMEDDINVIKSLIAISKGGLAVSDIPGKTTLRMSAMSFTLTLYGFYLHWFHCSLGQFREMNGTSLNFRKYGFSSVEEMLRSCREIYLWQSANGLMCRVNDEKMSHVTDLVNRTTVS